MRHIRRKKGGMISSPASYAQGLPWGVNMLPGVNGNVSEGGTFFSLNTIGDLDPPMNSSLKGGKTKRICKRKTRQKKRLGGSLKRKTRQKKRLGGSRNVTFGPMVNFMRNTLFNTNSLASQWNGRENELSPLPVVQSLNSTMPILQPPDVMKIHNNAGIIVSKI
uniref:Uncharacterized protein n=1 Tax=viral metagenome TaxID=1070528 RepID=A0A6C0JWG3_9ZZZZ